MFRPPGYITICQSAVKKQFFLLPEKTIALNSLEFVLSRKCVASTPRRDWRLLAAKFLTVYLAFTEKWYKVIKIHVYTFKQKEDFIFNRVYKLPRVVKCVMFD